MHPIGFVGEGNPLKYIVGPASKKKCLRQIETFVPLMSIAIDPFRVIYYEESFVTRRAKELSMIPPYFIESI